MRISLHVPCTWHEGWAVVKPLTVVYKGIKMWKHIEVNGGFHHFEGEPKIFALKSSMWLANFEMGTLVIKTMWLVL
jgi:hypothetical protein